ncbi:MAG: tetratricopeptide repeat protein [Phycisphaerales bacterium]|nr:tetratricopeptide repeat protein [Phycisphaerales bacterium]
MAHSNRSRLIMTTAALVTLLATGCGEPDVPPPPQPVDTAVLGGQVREAIEAQLAIVESNPADIEARAQLALLYQANSLPARSVETWDQVVTAQPDIARYWYCRALAFEEQGRYEDALASAKTARSLSPDTPALWWRPAFWELDMGRPEEAEVLASKAMAIAPDNAGSYVAMARSLMDQGRPEEAIPVLDELRKLTPHPYVVYLIGQAYQRNGQPEEAAPFLLQGKATQPPFPDPWNREVLDAQRGIDATIARIDRLLDESQLEAATQVVQEAQVTWPDDVNLVHRRSEIYRRRGDVKKWTLELKKALRMEPENAATHLNLSVAYLQQNERSKARNHAVSAVTYNPSIPAIHVQIAQLLLQENNLGKAAQALDEAFRLGLQDPRQRLQYAHVLLRVGRYAESEQNARKVVAVDQSNPLAWGVLAESLFAQGRREDAMNTLQSGLAIVPGDESLLMLSQRFQQLPTPGSSTP